MVRLKFYLTAYRVLSADIALTDHKRPTNTLDVFKGDIDLKDGFTKGFESVVSKSLDKQIEKDIIRFIEESAKLHNNDNGKNGDIIEIGVIYALGDSFGGRYCPDEDRIKINIKDYPKNISENDYIKPIIQSIKNSLAQDLVWNGKIILKIAKP